MLRAWPTVKLNGRPRSIAARPAGRRFGGNAVIYQGRLRVTDPVRFTQALREGIGAGRAWGLGLLMLFPSGEEEKKHGDVAD